MTHRDKMRLIRLGFFLMNPVGGIVATHVINNYMPLEWYHKFINKTNEAIERMEKATEEAKKD